MKKKNRSRDTSKTLFIRLSSALIGLLFIASGTAHLITGHLHYANHLGRLMFTPVLIFGGCFMLFYTIFRWDKTNEPKRK